MWGLKLSEGTKQENLVITLGDEPEITVDNIEVAHFVYLLLHNQKIRDVIDTIQGGADPWRFSAKQSSTPSGTSCAIGTTSGKPLPKLATVEPPRIAAADAITAAPQVSRSWRQSIAGTAALTPTARC